MPWGSLGPFSWTNRSGTRRFTFFGFWLLIPSAIGLLGYGGERGEDKRERSGRIGTKDEWEASRLEEVSKSRNGGCEW